MSYANGRLPDAALSAIAQGRLRTDAARAWNAMNAVSRARYGVTLVPLGSMSSYRTFAQQVYLYGTSRPGWAAVPGTSNHGWGLAIDNKTRQMRAIIDAIGRSFGYAKEWSDAAWEWWHITYRPGVWEPRPDPLRVLGKQQAAAAQRLLYHRRERKKEGRTGEGPQWRKQNRWVAYWRKRVERLHHRASGDRKRVLAKVLADRDGNV